MKIKAIIFDCWSTLFANKDEPHPFLVFAGKIGRDFNDYNFVKIFEKHFMLEKHYKLEIPIKQLLVELNINPPDELINELKDILVEAFKSHKAYPETLKVLKKLKKDYKLGLITNTDWNGFEKLEEKFKIEEIFDVALKSYETKILKPDPKIFEMMLEMLEVDKDEVLMVGDSLKDDIQAAENFGIKGILIDRKGKHPGYHNRITSLEQLKNFIN